MVCVADARTQFSCHQFSRSAPVCTRWLQTALDVLHHAQYLDPLPLQRKHLLPAGVVFKELPEVPPVTLAAWRLQLVSMIMVPPCLAQWWGMTSGVCPWKCC